MAGSFTRWPATPNGITPYATYADLPPIAAEGSFAVTLDTDTLYVYDSGWVAIAAPGTMLGVGTIDTGVASANGAHVDSNLLIMQSASATAPGLVNTTTQTFAGTKIFSAIGVNNSYPISALLDVHGNGNSTPQIQANNVGAQSSGGGAVIQTGADPGAAMSSGSRLGGFQFFGANDAAHTLAVGAAINAFATQAWTGSAQGTQLKFNVTANNATTRTTALTIDQDLSATFAGNISAANLSGTNTGDVAIGAVAGSSSTTGATISGQVLTLTPADLTNPGLMTASAQTFGGAKTFNSTISASNLSGTNTGDVAIGTANGLSLAGQALSLALSSGSTTGALSSADWTTFNSKQAAGNYITTLTGDATASGPGSAALTLATVNSNVGAFGSPTAIPTLTVNGKGLITAVTTNAVVAPAGTLTGTTLASNVVTSSLTSVGTIGTGVWQGTAVGATYGGTGGSSAASTGIPHVASGVWSYSTIVNADVSASAAIALSKLATVTASRALVSDGSGNISAATTTSTEIGYVNGVTSAIQTQINTKAPTASPTFTGTVTLPITGPGAVSVSSGGVAALVGLPTIQRFTSGSGTYTTPANCRWIRVTAIGAGGGGGGGGAGSGAGGAGGNTTFGSSLLTANGGAGGAAGAGSGNGGAGGSSTVTTSSSVLQVVALSGASGNGAHQLTTGSQPGGIGASSPLAGGGNVTANAAGGSGVTNSGAGGGGGGASAANSMGGGGGAGGYLIAVITGPSATYSYAVGAAGSAGAAGTNAGGTGGSGFIQVEEFYT